MSTAFTQATAVPLDGALPSQNTTTNGRALISNGTSAGWNTILSMIGSGSGQTSGAAVANTVLPAQTGSSGRFLTTDGAGNLSWATPNNAAGVSSIIIGGTSYTGAVTISNVPSATTASGLSTTLPISNGGTGATTASAALANLGGAAANHTHNYAPVDSPAFTGNPTAPTPAAADNDTSIATTAFVKTTVATAVQQIIPAISQLTDSGGPSFGMLVNGRIFEARVGGPSYGTYNQGRGAANGMPGQMIENICEIPVPEETTPFIKMYIGTYHAFALAQSGNLYAWGYNGYGQLGLGHNNNAYVPTLTATAVADFFFDDLQSRGNSLGYGRGIIKKTDGTIWVTGYNGYGQLGLGDTTNRNSWIHLAAAGSNPKFVGTVGGVTGFTVVQKSDGAIMVAGYNGHGQLGTGNTTNQPSLVDVTSAWRANANMEIKQLFGADGYDDSNGAYWLGMWLDDGTTSQIRTCGYNAWGQLGDGTVNTRSTPYIAVSTTGANRVRSATTHANGPGGILYVNHNNQCYAWGYNSFGQLGVGSTTNITVPTLTATNVSSVLLAMSSITSNHYGTVFLKKTDGTVWAAGYNGHAEVGDGSTIQRNSWVQVRFPRGVDVVEMGNCASSATGNVFIALTSAMSLYAWGYNGVHNVSHPEWTPISVPMRLNVELGL